MMDTPPITGRIAQLSFQEKQRLPHVFRLLAVAFRLYREHVLSYLVLSFLPFLVVRLLQASVVQTVSVDTGMVIMLGASVVVQLVSVLAIIAFARQGEGARLHDVLTVAFRQIFDAVGIVLGILLVALGAIGLILGPVMYVQGISILELASSPVLFGIANVIGLVAILATIQALYVLVYERVHSFSALLRALAYDRVSRFAILVRLLALVVFGAGVLFLIVYLGQLLYVSGVVSLAGLSSFDDVVVALLLPLFTLYGCALYEVGRVQLGGVSVSSGDRTTLGVLSVVGILVLLSVFL